MPKQKIKPQIDQQDFSAIEDFSASLKDLSLSTDPDSNDENLDSMLDKYGIPKTIN